jgi:hypothetical protein
MREDPNFVNEQDLGWGEQSHRERFGYRPQAVGLGRRRRETGL